VQLPDWLANGLLRADDYRLDPNGDLLFLLSPEDVETADWLQMLFPQGYRQTIQTYQPDESFQTFRVPAPGEAALNAAIEQMRLSDAVG